MNELSYSAEIESRTIIEGIAEEDESKVDQEDIVPSVLPLMID